VAESHAATIFRTPRRRKEADVRREPAGARRVRVDWEGGRLAGWEWGIGHKPLVLLVHGWSGLAGDMHVVASALVDAGCRAVAFDMPAHGTSPGRRTSLVEWLQALRAIDRWSGGLAGAVGHSFGATAVTLALEEGLGAPRAVLVSPAPGPMHYVERIRRFIGLPDERVPGMVRRLVEQVGREIPSFDAVRAARSLEHPALVLHDPADDEVPFEGVEALTAAWRGSRLELRALVGHYRIRRDAGVGGRVAAFLAP
jgi:pimeloyl-ACP methyl ester carboxylesterase